MSKIDDIFEIVLFLKDNAVMRHDALTKEDAKAFLTKEDAKLFATKQDLEDLALSTRSGFKEIKQQLQEMHHEMATVNDLEDIYNRMATKEDLKKVVQRV